MAHCPECMNKIVHKRGEVRDYVIEYDECEICGWNNIPPKYKK